MPERTIGFRDVIVVAGLCVVVVLGAAVATSILPSGVQAVVFHTPVLIVILVLGTAAALLRIARPRPPGD